MTKKIKAPSGKSVMKGRKWTKRSGRTGTSMVASGKPLKSLRRSTTIKKTGNGAFIPLSRGDLRALGAGIGTEVTVSADDGRMTVAKADSNYERTRRSAERMAARYAHTLKLFGQ